MVWSKIEVLDHHHIVGNLKSASHLRPAIHQVALGIIFRVEFHRYLTG